MKFATYWYGVQLLAETEQDKELLIKLKNTLPEKADRYMFYEYGEVSVKTDNEEIYEEYDDEVEDVISDYTGNYKYVLDFLR